MTIEVKGDSTTHHEFVTRKRDMIVRRLVKALDALDRKRHAVTHVVSDVAALLPGSSSSPSSSSSSSLAMAEAAPAARNALYGALAGGAVFALGLIVEHCRRERNRPLKVLQRAWFKYAMPPQPSLVSRLVTEAVGSLVLSFAQEAARTGVQRLLEARTGAADEGPVVLDRVSDSPDPNFVTEPVTVDPGVMHPRDAALPQSGIAPPDPIAPLLSPLREFA
jgi:hypothetical protein